MKIEYKSKGKGDNIKIKGTYKKKTKDLHGENMV